MWASCTVIMKNCGLILSGFIHLLGNMRHPHLGALWEQSFQLLAVLMEMIWFYSQTSLDANKYSSIVVREGSMLTYTTKEDKHHFSLPWLFWHSSWSDASGLQRTVNTELQICCWGKGAVAEFPWLMNTDPTRKRTWRLKCAEELLFPPSRAIHVSRLPAGPFSGQGSLQHLSVAAPGEALPRGSSSCCLPPLPPYCCLSAALAWGYPVIPSFNARPLFPLQSCTVGRNNKLFTAFDIRSCGLQTN